MGDETVSRIDGAHASTDPDAAAPTAPIAPPGYELLEVVGRGGMGVVYRARDVALDREVAVKVLLDRYAPGSPTAARFLDEARITAQLQHPGIPAVYQVGTLPGGRPYLAMKLIKGDTLDALLKADAPMDALAVFGAISQAVGYAHAHGVIHRDLKPANVMVGAFGEVQVMDWGLAKVLANREHERPESDPEATRGTATEIRTQRDSDTPFTQHGSVLGTPAYMPPEQAAGELHKVDARSDVFGLGGLLCVLLTGQPPFAGKDAESVRLCAVRGKTEDAFARLDASSADPGVIALCKRCLAFEPSDRPATADEVATAVAELRRAADDRAKQAERDKHAAEVQATERRKRVRVAGGLAAMVFAAVLAGGSAAIVQWRRASAALTQVREQEQATADALVAVRVEEAKAQAALTQVSSEQTRTAEALAAAERSGDATREGLVSWLRYMSSQTEGSLTDYDTRRDQSRQSTKILQSLIKNSVSNMKSGYEQILISAECNRMLGDIYSAHNNRSGDDGYDEYSLAIVLTRKLIGEKPNSASLNRQLADCLYRICELSKSESRGLLSASHKANAAVSGAIIYSYANITDKWKHSIRLLDNLDESIRLRKSLSKDATEQDQILLARAYQLTYEIARDQRIPNSMSFAYDELNTYKSNLIYNSILSEENTYQKLLNSRSFHNDDFKRNKIEDRLLGCLVMRADFELNQKNASGLACMTIVRANHMMRGDLPDASGKLHLSYEREIAKNELFRIKCGISLADKNHSVLFSTAKDWQYFKKECCYAEYRTNMRSPLGYIARCINLAKNDTFSSKLELSSKVNEYSSEAVRIIKDTPLSLDLAYLLFDDAFIPLMDRADIKEFIGGLASYNKTIIKLELGKLSLNPAASLAVATKMALKTDLNHTEIYDLASIYSVASKRTSDNRDELSVTSIQLLHRAIASGWKDRVRIAEDTHLNPLRERPDFQKLLDSLPYELAPPPREAK